MKYLALFMLIYTSVAYTSDYTFPSHVSIGYYATDADYYSNQKTATLAVPITPDMELYQLQHPLRVNSDDPYGKLIWSRYQKPVLDTPRWRDPLSLIFTSHKSLLEFEKEHYFRSTPTHIPGIFVQAIGMTEKSAKR